MNSIWQQKSSVTRDFTLLSVVIIFIAILTSFWVSLETFSQHVKHQAIELDAESRRVDTALNNEISRAAYLLQAMATQIKTIGVDDPKKIAALLHSYNSSSHYYSLFMWIDREHKIVTNSAKGVLEMPIPVGNLDYIQLAHVTPFTHHLGQPTIGNRLERSVLPIIYGITDDTGRYLGAVALSLDLDTLTRMVKENLHDETIGFSIISEKKFDVLAQDENAKLAFIQPQLRNKLNENDIAPGTSGLVENAELFGKNKFSVFYRYSYNQPYIIITTAQMEWSVLQRLILPRLLQLSLVAAFLVSLLWLVRFRIIYPLQGLIISATEIARGNTKIEIPSQGPSEVLMLGKQLQNILYYIAERKRIENELTSKLLGIRSIRELAEINEQAKIALMAIMKQETLPTLAIVGTEAAALQEQFQGARANKSHRTAMDSLYSNLTHLNKTLNELFSLPSLSYQQLLESPHQPQDVAAILHECVSLLSGTITHIELIVTIHSEPDLPKLVFSELQLSFLLMELLLLCIRQIPAGGEIGIHTKVEYSNNQEAEFSITFRDHGTGMDIQHISKLWREADQGYRANQYRSASAEETGEQLHSIALAKKIIAVNNGRITMQNQPDKEAVLVVHFKSQSKH